MIIESSPSFIVRTISIFILFSTVNIFLLNSILLILTTHPIKVCVRDKARKKRNSADGELRLSPARKEDAQARRTFGEASSGGFLAWGATRRAGDGVCHGRAEGLDVGMLGRWGGLGEYERRFRM